jgi:hypothetical protein
MTPNGKLANAWILLSEDEPSGATYDTPGSSYQMLIENNVYRSVDVLFICFVNTVPTGPATVPAGDGTSYTLQIDPASHGSGPDALTNEDYLQFVIRDARANNPNIRIAVTLDFNTLTQGSSATTISQIFSSDTSQWPQNAADFAANVMTYLQHYGLNGFDIDWESPLSDNTTAQQFALVINAIGTLFEQQATQYLLTISPAVAENLDATAVNDHVTFINLQLYSGFTQPADFQQAGIDARLFAYGAKFEAIGPGPDEPPYQTAAEAIAQNAAKYHYRIFTNWRLNSSNFQVEQNQQVTLHTLVKTLPQ